MINHSLLWTYLLHSNSHPYPIPCCPFRVQLVVLLTIQHSHLRSVWHLRPVWVQLVILLTVQHSHLRSVQQSHLRSVWVQLVVLLTIQHSHLQSVTFALELQAMVVPQTLKSIFFVYFFFLLFLSVQQFIYINHISYKESPAIRQ